MEKAGVKRDRAEEGREGKEEAVVDREVVVEEAGARQE